MILGSDHGRAVVAMVLLLSGALLAGCEDGSGPAPSSTSSSGADVAKDTAMTTPSEDPSMSETTPTIEPATGRTLKQRFAEITLPEGWKIDENSADGALVQASSSSGILTMIEIEDGPEGPVASTLAGLAKVELRSIGDPAIRRLDDAVIGEDTPAYRLAGRTGVGRNYYEEYYGVAMGSVEYTMNFSFFVPHVSVTKAKKTIESIMVTWRSTT